MMGGGWWWLGGGGREEGDPRWDGLDEELRSGTRAVRVSVAFCHQPPPLAQSAVEAARRLSRDVAGFAHWLSAPPAVRAHRCSPVLSRLPRQAM